MYTNVDMSNMLANAARQAQSPSFYNYFQKDEANIAAIRQWIRLTKSTRRLDTLQLTVGSDALPALPTGFVPNLALEAYLTLNGFKIEPGLEITTIQNILHRQAQGFTQTGLQNQNPPTTPPTGRPTMLGFSDRATGKVDYLCDKAYVVNLWWYRTLTAWTMGQAFLTPVVSGGVIASITVNIPGSLYASAPTITITDPTGVNFAAGAVTMNTTYGIASVAVSNGGTGYTNPTVLVNGVAANPITFDLTDEELEQCATEGAVYYLQKMEPKNAQFAAARKKAFEDAAKGYAAIGQGSKGAQVLQRVCPYDSRGNWTR